MAERSYCREEGQAQEQSGVPPAEDGGGRWPPAVFQPQSSSEAPRGEGPGFRGRVQTLTHTCRRLAHLSALSGLLCRGGQREHPPPGAAMERKGLRLRKEPRPAPGHVGASHHRHCHSPRLLCKFRAGGGGGSQSQRATGTVPWTKAAGEQQAAWARRGTRNGPSAPGTAVGAEPGPYSPQAPPHVAATHPPAALGLQPRCVDITGRGSAGYTACAGVQSQGLQPTGPQAIMEGISQLG